MGLLKSDAGFRVFATCRLCGDSVHRDIWTNDKNHADSQFVEWISSVGWFVMENDYYCPGCRGHDGLFFDEQASDAVDEYVFQSRSVWLVLFVEILFCIFSLVFWTINVHRAFDDSGITISSTLVLIVIFRLLFKRRI